MKLFIVDFEIASIFNGIILKLISKLFDFIRFINEIHFITSKEENTNFCGIVEILR